MSFKRGDKVIHLDLRGEPVYAEALEVMGILEGRDRQYCDLRSMEKVIKKGVSADRLRPATAREIVMSGFPGSVVVEVNFVTISDTVGEVIHWEHSDWVSSPDLVPTIARMIRLNFQQGSIGVRRVIGKADEVVDG